MWYNYTQLITGKWTKGHGEFKPGRLINQNKFTTKSMLIIKW